MSGGWGFKKKGQEGGTTFNVCEDIGENRAGCGDCGCPDEMGL